MAVTRMPAAPSAARRAARRGCGMALLGAGLAAALLRDWLPAEQMQLFVVGLGIGLRQVAPASGDSAEVHGARLARAAFSWDVETTSVELPVDPDEMVQQAANAVMRAYRKGHARQTIHLRLSDLFDMEQTYLKGQAAVVNATLPMMRSFTARLWGGDQMKKLRVSVVDEEVGTLIYREAEQEQMDAAVLFLAGRPLMREPKTQTFISDMKDRLLLLANIEDAPEPWKIENNGSDFNSELASKVGETVCETFAEQSYYYRTSAFNNWKLTVFRVYPFNWEYYIESLDYKLVKIGDSDRKLNYYETIRLMESYEQETGVRPTQKVGKMIKDSLGEEEESNKREPGWRTMKKDF